MKKLAALASLFLASLAPPQRAHAENWQAWRGPRGDGTSDEKSVPVKWNGKTGENIAWKTAIPGAGHASPIIWNDRIFTVSTLEDKGERVLF